MLGHGRSRITAPLRLGETPLHRPQHRAGAAPLGAMQTERCGQCFAPANDKLEQRARPLCCGIRAGEVEMALGKFFGEGFEAVAASRVRSRC